MRDDVHRSIIGGWAAICSKSGRENLAVLALQTRAPRHRTIRMPPDSDHANEIFEARDFNRSGNLNEREPIKCCPAVGLNNFFAPVAQRERIFAGGTCNHGAISPGSGADDTVKDHDLHSFSSALDYIPHPLDFGHRVTVHPEG